MGKLCCVLLAPQAFLSVQEGLQCVTYLWSNVCCCYHYSSIAMGCELDQGEVSQRSLDVLVCIMAGTGQQRSVCELSDLLHRVLSYGAPICSYA